MQMESNDTKVLVPMLFLLLVMSPSLGSIGGFQHCILSWRNLYCHLVQDQGSFHQNASNLRSNAESMMRSYDGAFNLCFIVDARVALLPWPWVPLRVPLSPISWLAGNAPRKLQPVREGRHGQSWSDPRNKVSMASMFLRKLCSLDFFIWKEKTNKQTKISWGF